MNARYPLPISRSRHSPAVAPESAEAPSVPSFEVLYAESFAFVWRSLRRLGVREADLDDAAQEVFLVVHRRLPEFELRAKVTTWLFKICLRTARSRARRVYLRREVPGLELEELAEERDDPAADLSRRQDLRLFERAMSRLDVDQRAVFILFELESLSGQEIADALEIPLGTVYSRLRLAREAFRRTAHALMLQREPWRRAEGTR